MIGGCLPVPFASTGHCPGGGVLGCFSQRDRKRKKWRGSASYATQKRFCTLGTVALLRRRLKGPLSEPVRLYPFLETGMRVFVYFGPCSAQAAACMTADGSKDRRVRPPPCMASMCSQNK